MKELFLRAGLCITLIFPCARTTESAQDEGYQAEENTSLEDAWAYPIIGDQQSIQKIRDLKARILEYPKDPILRLELGNEFICIEDYESAIVELKQAVALDSVSVQAMSTLGFAYIHKRNFDEAEKMLMRAMEIDNDYIPTLKYLAYLHYLLPNGLHNFKKARSYLERAISLSGGHRELSLYVPLGLLLGKECFLEEKEICSEAKRVWQKILELSRRQKGYVSEELVLRQLREIEERLK